jgi:plastocyanin
VAVKSSSFAALVLLVVVLAGCGGKSSSSSSSSGSGSGGGSGGVTATETEYKIALSTTKLSAGKVTFNVKDMGSMTHAFTITGPGVNSTTAHIAPGSSASLTVTLKAGDYELYCPIDGHKGLGMDMHIIVGAGSASGGGATTTGGSSSSWG